MNKKCFALKNNKCKVLTATFCDGDYCPFYKTKKKFTANAGKAMERLASLELYIQDSIAEKYYDGKYVWTGGGRR